VPDNEEKTVKKIKESLDFLDSSLEVKKPDLMKLVQLVNEVEEKKEEGRNRQFLTFLLSAVLIVTMEVLAFSRSFTIFAVIQAAAVAFILPAIIVMAKKRRRQVTGR
jgi:hypothetical protein